MSTARTLFIDADDTLWENNIYFERVSASFVTTLGQRGVDPQLVGAELWKTEQRNIGITGYGSNAFCQSLHQVALQLGHADLEPDIQEWERWILTHPIELMPGVRETLPLLHAKHRLILMTKGRAEEQLGKLERSGLAGYFHECEVVFEKSSATYRDVLVKYSLPAQHAWMIGNSPRSDINPAKAAGLGTVFIPYHTTWQHEIEEIAPNGGTIVLKHFGQLVEYFG